MNKWTLNIGEFGKIRNSSIEVSPFMIFVGDNNSGKSYVMELLWAIISRTDEIVENMNDIIQYEELLHAPIQSATKTAISADIQQTLIDCFNIAFAKKKTDFIKKIYNHAINAKELKITRNDYFNLSYKIDSQLQNIAEFDEEGNEKEVLWRISHIHIFFEDNVFMRGRIRNKPDESVDTKKIVDFIYKRVMIFLIRKDYFNVFATNKLVKSGYNKEPLYFPASRTGFMHTYRAIIGNQRLSQEDVDEITIEEADSKDYYQIAGTNLTLPTILFLEKLQKLTISTDQLTKYEKQLQFLSEKVLEGTVTKNAFEQFEFVPANSTTAIPLHVTSSLVAELTPIAMFLSSSFDPDLWIIEEVESHLHPKIQLEVARFLVRLFHTKKASG